MASCMSCLLSRSSDRRSQHFCDVCKYMFRMDQSNGHNNQCSNCVFKVCTLRHQCSTVNKVQNILGSTMMCLSNSSLSNTIHHSIVILILLESTTRAPSIMVTMICMSTMIVQIARLLSMTAIVCVIPVTAMSPPPFSKVLVPMKFQRSSSMVWMDVSSTTIHSKTRLGLYLIMQMASLSLLNSRYHHHASWTWVHMSLSSCCS